MAEVRIRDLTKSYGAMQVVHGVNVDIQDGQFVVLVGPSGCGKSTLLRMIAGLEGITGGTVSIGDRVVNNLPPAERDIAMVFQNYALYPHKTVGANMGFPLKMAGMTKAEIDTRVNRAADILGLKPYLDRYPRALSGGQRQRVAMGRAIVRDPQVFLFDEPLSNLDAKLRVQMRHEIRRIHNAVGATSVFVTHDQHEGMTLADRLVIMNKGTIEQIGTPEEIYEHPASLYVAGFVGSPGMNILPGTVASSGLSVLLGDGQALDIQASFKARAGQLVQIGLRPEKLSITTKAHGLLAAKFQFFEELGSARIYHLEIEDIPVGVVSDLKLALTAGEEVGLAFPPSALHVFDGPSGRSLARAGAMGESRGTDAGTPGLSKMPAAPSSNASFH